MKGFRRCQDGGLHRHVASGDVRVFAFEAMDIAPGLVFRAFDAHASDRWDDWPDALRKSKGGRVDDGCPIWYFESTDPDVDRMKLRFCLYANTSRFESSGRLRRAETVNWVTGRQQIEVHPRVTELLRQFTNAVTVWLTTQWQQQRTASAVPEADEHAALCRFFRTPPGAWPGIKGQSQG